MAEHSRTHRLFFALWPDDATRAAIAHATRKAVRGSGGRPIAIGNLHSTVAFLGPVAEDRMPGLLDAVDGANAGSFTTGPFQVTLDGIDHWARPAVLCAICSQPPAAAVELADRLRSQLARSGFTPDLKPFLPHVTLARKVVKPHALGPMPPVTWQVADLALVESETAPEGSRYAVLRRWSL